MEGQGLRRKLLGAFAGITLAAGGLVPWATVTAPVVHAQTATVRNYALSAGVKLTTIRYPGAPNEVRIVSVVASKGPRIDLAPGQSQFPLWNRTSSISAAHTGAVAGVNGDFATSTGMPSHVTMVDGELWTTGSVSGMGFGISDDGQQAYIGHPRIAIQLRTVSGVQLAAVARWNAGTPKLGAINAYTKRGGTVSPPPGSTNPTKTSPRYCAVRLNPVKGYGYTWTGSGKKAITRRYIVAVKPEPCAKTPLSLGNKAAAVVLAARNATAGADTIMALQPGEVVRLWWTARDWPGVTDIIGGSPMLVDDKVNVAPNYTSGANNILWYNPRTSVGVTRGCSDQRTDTTCKVFIVTVDGRQKSTGWSKGYKMPGIASELLKLGVWDAMNLDGGGSTTMWVKRRHSGYCESTPAVGGCLVNRPSPSSGERVAVEALTVLSGSDGGTPIGLR